MAFVNRSGHTIPGSGLREFGFRHSVPSVIFGPSPCLGGCHGHCYHYGSSKGSLLGSGIVLTILGVALTALGVLSFAVGDAPSGIVFTAIGGLGIAIGTACIVARLASKKFK